MPEKQVGYIYIFINPSLQKNMIKIGQTNRSPEERAEELSSGSGVVASYTVAYEEKVKDPHLVESRIHQRLKDFRINPEREFFRLPLKDAISAVREVVNEMDATWPDTEKFELLGQDNLQEKIQGFVLVKGISIVCPHCGKSYSVTFRRYEHYSVCPFCLGRHKVAIYW